MFHFRFLKKENDNKTIKFIGNWVKAPAYYGFSTSFLKS